MGSLGLRRVAEADALGDPEVQTVSLSGIGRLRLADTVYVTQDGAKTIGLLFARDHSARTCLLTLDLRLTQGPAAWLATVESVTCAGVRSSEGLGASFLFSPRQRSGE
jgi:hypothetical protein